MIQILQFSEPKGLKFTFSLNDSTSYGSKTNAGG